MRGDCLRVDCCPTGIAYRGFGTPGHFLMMPIPDWCTKMVTHNVNSADASWPNIKEVEVEWEDAATPF